MSISDSAKNIDWLTAILTAIQKIDWRVEAAIATTAAFVLILAGNDALWFKDVPSLYLVITAIVFILFALHMLFCWVDYLRKRVLESRNKRIQRKFNKLSDGQKELLTRIFRNRNRKFQIETKNRRDDSRYRLGLLQQKLHNQFEIPRIPRLLEPREFEELIKYNYIESDGKFMQSESFSITENGWHELEK